MLRAILCSSSGGQILLLLHMVSSLSVSSYSVHRLRADSVDSHFQFYYIYIYIYIYIFVTFTETNLSSFLRVLWVKLLTVPTRVLSQGNVNVIFCRKVSIEYIFLLVFCFSSANIAPLVLHICVSSIKGIDSMPKKMFYFSLNRMYASFYITDGHILVWLK